MEGSLGKRISACRKRLGLTQEQLADKLDLTAQAVSKWENDISCPDITILPLLADIFGITTDELLGHEIPKSAQNVEIITEKQPNSCFEYDSDSGKMNFQWNGIKLEGIGLASWVLLTGAIYLVTQLLYIEITLWDVIWPSFLFVFGLFGLYPKFSVFRLVCTLVGSYFLADKLHLLELHLNKGTLFAVWILIFGLSLLCEVLRKNTRNHTSSNVNKNKIIPHGKISQDYSSTESTFSYDVTFGNSTQIVKMDMLSHGTISASFGEHTVDLRGVVSIESVCKIQADCSFGTLVILVPCRYCVLPDSSTSFARFDIQGSPSQTTDGTILLSADVSFGDITIQYI